jgi:uncharacterized Fe-S cluster-containing radical SAM superfamily protein
VASGCLTVFAATWFATPALHALRTTPTHSPPEVAATERSLYYSGCDQVRAAGADPIYGGEPGYRPEMDGDGDGIACEPYR